MIYVLHCLLRWSFPLPYWCRKSITKAYLQLDNQFGKNKLSKKRGDPFVLLFRHHLHTALWNRLYFIPALCIPPSAVMRILFPFFGWHLPSHNITECISLYSDKDNGIYHIFSDWFTWEGWRAEIVKSRHWSYGYNFVVYSRNSDAYHQAEFIKHILYKLSHKKSSKQFSW